MRKVKLTRANKSILMKALGAYYYQRRAIGVDNKEVGCLILKIDSLPADKRASFSTEEIHLMRTTINRLRNERIAQGQYTDAADDMLLKLFKKQTSNENKNPIAKVHCNEVFECARLDSNQRPLESESNALSICATSAYI